jgi:Protein tyrosine and serine/threonine kinase
MIETTELTAPSVEKDFDLTTEEWRWMAPELMLMEESIPQVTTATDVYSFAMTVLEVRETSPIHPSALTIFRADHW